MLGYPSLCGLDGEKMLAPILQVNGCQKEWGKANSAIRDLKTGRMPTTLGETRPVFMITRAGQGYSTGFKSGGV